MDWFDPYELTPYEQEIYRSGRWLMGYARNFKSPWEVTVGKRGPAKGHGGRPRKKESEVAVRNDGYKRVTVGPKSKGQQVYAHRAKAYGGTPPKVGKGSKTVVDHKNKKRSDNRKSNLRLTGRGKR